MKLDGGDDELRPYRIGWHEPKLTRQRRPWKPWHRPWQAEAPSHGPMFARRALTPAGARRKMQRDAVTHLRTGRPSRYQRLHLWLKKRGLR